MPTLTLADLRRGLRACCYELAVACVIVCGFGCATPAVKAPSQVPSQTRAQSSLAQLPVQASVPPQARREQVVDNLHGLAIEDPYRWLEDPSSPEVQSWLAAHDVYARSKLSSLPGQAALRKRLTELMYYDSLYAPIRRGERTFWQRKHADKEKLVVYVKEGDGGAPRVLFDPNTWSEDGSTSLGGFWPSRDGELVAYSIKENNADEASLHVMEVASGKVLSDVIEGAKYAHPSWTPDGLGFYYTWVPPIGGEVTVPARPGFAEIRHHLLGTDPSQDRVVREKSGDPGTFLDAFVSHDGRYLVAQRYHGWNATDVYFRDLTAKQQTWTTLVEGVDANFETEVFDRKLYVLTNLDAPRFRLFVVDLRQPARAKWKEIVPQQADSTISSFKIVGGRLALTRLRNATSELELRHLDGSFLTQLPLPGRGTTHGMVGEPDDGTAYFAYSSFTEPGLVFEVDIAQAQAVEWSRVELPFERDAFVTEQVSYPSKDGTPISMFLVHRKDVLPGTDHPTLLTGYGGFNVSMTPEFAGARIAWLELGGVYAVPNLRGGSEYGESWHKAGMLLNKQNVFDDFIAAAQWLIREGWTRPNKLGIVGRSNGGLLVGAAMTQAPELFGAVVCGVPLLDMVRYHQFGSGKTWVPEYGSADDPAQLRALYGYSPYHHVTRGVRYPALLMLAADHDDRVDPMHARKMAAQIAWASSHERPVLLRLERNAGHAGADLVRQKLEETADTYAFLLSELERDARL